MGAAGASTGRNGRPCAARSWRLGVVAALLAGAQLATGCSAGVSGRGADAGVDDGGPGGGPAFTLRINELVADNEGVAVDEEGGTDDLIELVNAGTEPLALDDYTIGSRRQRQHPLPTLQLAPGARLLLWADGAPEQGATHLPFRLAAAGESVVLMRAGGAVLDAVDFPALAPNESYARFPDASGPLARCRFASPGRPNGARCGVPPPTELPTAITWAPYAWPQPWSTLRGPLVLNELALRPNAADGPAFVELFNLSDRPVSLADLSLRLSAHGPGLAWPSPSAGVALPLPVAELAAGAYLAVEVPATALAPLAVDPAFEGVLTLFAREDGAVIDRVDFMRWPLGSALARLPDHLGAQRFCRRASRGGANSACDELPSREVGDRLRHLRTPGDFAALAAGGTQLGIAAVKLIVDLQAGEVVHLLSTRAWDLHYTFVRELIDGQPHLDRCDPADAAVFNRGWYDFSEAEYFRSEGRRFLLGTLLRYGASALASLEFANGDMISGAQMQRAFFATMQHVDRPQAWSIRPVDAHQLAEARTIEGAVPLADPSAPFRGLRFQPLTEAVGYGVLRFVAASELAAAALGPQVIVVTDDVPNDLPLVAGLITEAFQTPLAHVNLLSRARNTPNLALREARSAPELAPYFGQLVRLEVGNGGFSLRAATATEAQAFWDAQRPEGATVAPRLDESVRALLPLSSASLADLPAIGAKAAQLAELNRVVVNQAKCGPAHRLPLPREAFALPLVHAREHFVRSGAASLLAQLRADAQFTSDPTARAQGLLRVQAAILEQAVDPPLLAQLTQAIRERFGTQRVRLRSSSNSEDLPEFNGAGLYASVSAALDDPERPLARALRQVWAGLWSLRAYDERELARIDHARVGMGVLVHEAFTNERANGVAVSRNVLDPTQDDIYYVNAQVGEASVTNPAPGVSTEELLYSWGWPPELTAQQRSSLLPTGEVLSLAETRALVCALRAIDLHFRPRLDPAGSNRWFAMELEFKLLGAERTLMIKQARPFSFGAVAPPQDCR
ncbi:MAG: hypothetical protein IPL40_07360 [Proteobacteria bacterium]|nr:hypothetical protein [Pseudomonadota bacterium]